MDDMRKAETRTPRLAPKTKDMVSVKKREGLSVERYSQVLYEGNKSRTTIKVKNIEAEMI